LGFEEYKRRTIYERLRMHLDLTEFIDQTDSPPPSKMRK